MSIQSLLSAADISSATGIYANHFPTFYRPITINKEPKKIINYNNSPVPGYGNISQTTNISYVPVSGIYSGILIYDRDQKFANISESKTPLSKGKVKLKVQFDAYSYIKAGKTENIAVDGLLFNVISDEGVQNFLGLNYYYFMLEQTS